MRAPALVSILIVTPDHPEVVIAAALLRDPAGTPQLFGRRRLRLRSALPGFTSVGRRVDALLTPVARGEARR